MKSFQNVIDLWDSRTQLADDIGELANTVSKWWQRDSIPPEQWLAVCAAAKKRDFQGVTVEQMATIAAVPKKTVAA